MNIYELSMTIKIRDFVGDIFDEDDYDPIKTIKEWRNTLLQISDWTQGVDAPLTEEKRQEWAEWRQQLRDFPSTWVPGEFVTFPDPPSKD